MNRSDLSFGDRVVISALMQRHVAFAINRCMRLGIEPIPLSLGRICEIYDTMKETCGLYSERKGSLSWLKKRDIRLSELELLRIVEFESAHYTFKRNAIDPKNTSDIHNVFMDLIYQHPERYTFFESRESVIQSYNSFGWLNIADFTRNHD